jgi:aspartate 1-decarboxylase
MLRYMLKAKIHRATITQADINYEGSLTIDRDLMDAADIVPFEKVGVYNINNGNRFETYAIEGERGTGVIGLNGAAARKGMVGDLIIIATYTAVARDEMGGYRPTILLLDAHNKVKQHLDK